MSRSRRIEIKQPEAILLSEEQDKYQRAQLCIDIEDLPMELREAFVKGLGHFMRRFAQTRVYRKYFPPTITYDDDRQTVFLETRARPPAPVPESAIPINVIGGLHTDPLR